MLKRVRRKILILVTLLIIPVLLYILRCSSGTSDTITSASPKAKKESFLREAMFYWALSIALLFGMLFFSPGWRSKPKRDQSCKRNSRKKGLVALF